MSQPLPDHDTGRPVPTNAPSRTGVEAGLVPPPFARPTSVRRALAVVGTVVVGMATIVATFVGSLSPMAADGCSDVGGPQPAQCANADVYIPLLIVGPLVLCAATLVAVWFRTGGRPRVAWFLVWAPALVLVEVWGFSLTS